MTAKKSIAVIGAGAWGTALSIVLANNGCDVYLWSHAEEEMQAMVAEKRNSAYLPTVRENFPETLYPCIHLEDAMPKARHVLMVVPSHAFRAQLQKLLPWLKKNHLGIVTASKGLDPEKNVLLHHVVAEFGLSEDQFAVLSGPSFAAEVAHHLPTVVSLASASQSFLQEIAPYFQSHHFALSFSHDVVGVELGGVIKNIYAIATGMCDGLGYGANTRSALITAALAEMLRLGQAMGAHPDTLLGPSGLGDLILTCTDNQSRNRQFGLLVGKHQSVAKAIETMSNKTVEGYKNVPPFIAFAAKAQVEIPIINQMDRILNANAEPRSLIETLMKRASNSVL